MSVIHLPAVRDVAQRLTDVPHDLALVMLRGDSGAYAPAVCTREGTVLAWDGWNSGSPADDEMDIRDLEWDDWDDMPSKLLLGANRAALARDMAFELMPTYSPARVAAELVATWAEGSTDAPAVHRMEGAKLVCYLPVVDGDVYERTLKAESAL